MRCALHSILTCGATAGLVAAGVGGTQVQSPMAVEAQSSSGWSSAGTMIAAAQDQTATLLSGSRCNQLRIQCGDVLVTGGYDVGNGTHPQDASVYDPLLRRWTVNSVMLHPRAEHTATQLRDGRILVAGGSNASSALGLASAEIFDPADGTWTATASMSVPRRDQTATLLWSQACDGHQPPPYCGKVLVAGGDTKVVDETIGGVPTDPSEVQGSSAELFDPVSGRWTATGQMAYPHSHASALALPDGRVLVAGGRGFVEPQPWAEIYDPLAGTWSSAGMLNIPRIYQTATLLTGPACVGSKSAAYCGTVLLVGGVVDYEGSNVDSLGGGALASAESYDPATNTWTLAASMMQPRGRHVASLLADGRVLVAGGGVTDEAAAEIFDPAGGAPSGVGWGAWSATAPMAQGRLDATATLLWWPGCSSSRPPVACGEVLVTGGFSQPMATITALDSAETFGGGVKGSAHRDAEEEGGAWRGGGAAHPEPRRFNPAF